MGIKATVCVLIGMGFAFGAALLLGPVAWRYGKRTVVRVQSGHRWEAWCANGGREAQDGDPVGWLTIPSCGIDAIILKGGSRDNLAKSICSTTVRFDDGHSLTVFSGHRDTHFRGLRQLEVGRLFSIERADGVVNNYRVAEIDTVPSAQLTAQLGKRAKPGWVVLMTCYPFRYIGPAPERCLVWGCPQVLL